MTLYYIDGLVQERCNYGALAPELRLSCTKPLRYSMTRVSAWLKSNYEHMKGTPYFTLMGELLSVLCELFSRKIGML